MLTRYNTEKNRGKKDVREVLEKETRSSSSKKDKSCPAFEKVSFGPIETIPKTKKKSKECGCKKEK